MRSRCFLVKIIRFSQLLGYLPSSLDSFVRNFEKFIQIIRKLTQQEECLKWNHITL